MHLCIKTGRNYAWSLICDTFDGQFHQHKLAKYILCLTVNVDGTVKLFKTKQFHWHSESINNIRTIAFTLVQCGECSLRKLLSR